MVSWTRRAGQEIFILPWVALVSPVQNIFLALLYLNFAHQPAMHLGEKSRFLDTCQIFC